MNQKVFLIFVFLVCTLCFSQSRYNFIYGNGIGTKAGAENIASVHYLWQNFDNRFIVKKININSKITNIAFRLGKLFLLDYPITFVLPSVQHERFGHGSRAQEFGATIATIRITLPPPFDFRLPGISYQHSKKTTIQQDLITTASGSGANTVLADVLRRNMLLDQVLDYHAALLYLYANNDLSGYAAFAANNGSPGNDIIRYVKNLNGFYDSNHVTVKKLRIYGMLSILLDPMNYYAFNSLFNAYIYKGREKSKIPLITMNNIQYLPKLKFGLTPYGIEFILQNYLKRNKILYAINMGISDGVVNKSWRIEAQVWNIALKNNLFLNISSQIWNQPKIAFYDDNTLKSSENFGSLLLSTINYYLISKKKIRLVLSTRLQI